MENFLKCMWMLVLTIHPNLALRLRKRELYLCHPWAFMACSRVSFTFINLLVSQNF